VSLRANGLPTSLKWISAAALAVAAVAFLFSISGLVKIMIVSALLAYIIDPLATYLESRGMKRPGATAIVFLMIVAVMALAFLVLAPMLVNQIVSIQQSLKGGHADAMIDQIEQTIASQFSSLGVKDIHIGERLQAYAASTAEWFFDHILDMVSLLTNIIIIPFIVFFLLKDGRQIKKQFVSLMPNRYFELSLNLLHKMDEQLGNYLRGQFLDAVVIGILSTVALWLLDVKYSFLFGAFAGIANLIPYLGPVLGAALAIVVTVFETGNLSIAWSILLAFIVVKLVDDVVIQPVIIAKSVDMHPLLVLLAVLVGGKFFGILGMLLSVPATGFLKVALQEGMASYRRFR
jgi:putative permease